MGSFSKDGASAPRRGPSIIAAALSLALLTTAGPARAEDADQAELNAPHKLRSGVVLGFNLGIVGFFGASGYPNEVSKIDDPAYYAASGVTGGLWGNTISLHIMGALADWLNFGIWFGGGSARNSHWISSGGGGGFRVEAFPLHALVPRLKDLGILGQFGVGNAALKPQYGSSPGATGAQSYLGTGVFYEFNLGKSLGGHFGWGPSLEYQVVTSTSIERHGGVFGARLAFYGGV